MSENMNKKNIINILIIMVVIGSSLVLFLNNFNIKDSQYNDDWNDSKMHKSIYKVNININGTNYTATLEDNETTRELINRFPIEINMNELNGNEKYYYFSDSLPSNPSRIEKINNGDLMLYGSDCLVLFYETFNTSYSYTKIGKIDNPSSLKNSVGKGNIKISFSK